MNLEQWLAKIEQLHPIKWDLGLERVGEVAKRLSVQRPAKISFLVAGTNGKGSTCEYLEALCLKQGLRVGKTTSPHFLHFNERIVINGAPVGDEAICSAFEEIDSIRGDISLSYFEFAALAALLIFTRASLDVAVVEVGLGGRLDAMNVIEPDVSIITQIAMDHEAWLGNTRDAIGHEKAGIMRAGKMCVVADPDPPQSIAMSAHAIGTSALYHGEHFSATKDAFTLTGRDGEMVELPDLPATALPGQSALTALQALECVGLLPDLVAVREVLSNTRLVGRMQWLGGRPRVLLDVAHNPAAATYLAHSLKSLELAGQVHAVVGMYADKHYGEVFAILKDHVSHWYLADMDDPRAAKSKDLQACLSVQGALDVRTYDKVSSAYKRALRAAALEDLVLVFGSFVAVAQVLEVAGNHSNQINKAD